MVTDAVSWDLYINIVENSLEKDPNFAILLWKFELYVFAPRDT